LVEEKQMLGIVFGFKAIRTLGSEFSRSSWREDNPARRWGRNFGH